MKYKKDLNFSLLSGNKIIDNNLPVKIEELKHLKIAVHLHVYYLDIFEKYISYFNKINLNIHLFITTDTEEKSQYIKNYSKEHLIKNIILENIFIFNNYGRDILPWLLISEHLGSFDIAGHFHTKKSVVYEENIGLEWQEELFNLLLVPINNIINTFFTSPDVGLVIPDIPVIFQLDPIVYPRERNNQILMNKLWKFFEINTSIDFTSLYSVIFPYGNMFWYRPSAIKPLLNIDINSLEIPKEPLTKNRTFLHAIERIYVYISYSQGFDFRISSNINCNISGFHNNLVLNDYIYHIKTSKNYLIGKFILAFPRFIKNILFKKINN